MLEQGIVSIEKGDVCFTKKKGKQDQITIDQTKLETNTIWCYYPVNLGNRWLPIVRTYVVYVMIGVVCHNKNCNCRTNDCNCRTNDIPTTYQRQHQHQRRHHHRHHHHRHRWYDDNEQMLRMKSERMNWIDPKNRRRKSSIWQGTHVVSGLFAIVTTLRRLYHHRHRHRYDDDNDQMLRTKSERMNWIDAKNRRKSIHW